MSRRISFQAAFFVLTLSALCLTGWISGASGDARKERPIPPPPTEPFSPSNARTEDGGLIPVEQFFPAQRCVGCHQDTHAA
jgi:hypothetical protein